MIARAGLLVACALGLLACSKPDPSPSTPPSASAPASVATPSAPASASAGARAEQRDRWYAGAWTGKYEAKHYLIEVPKGEGAKEWKDDDGTKHVGDGTLSLDVNDTGLISGTATGPLGDQKITGEVDGEHFRVHFSPKQPGEQAFGGFAVLAKSGATLSGRLQASSGDSRTVRDATIEVSKGGSGAPPAKAAPSAPAPARSAP